MRSPDMDSSFSGWFFSFSLWCFSFLGSFAFMQGRGFDLGFDSGVKRRISRVGFDENFTSFLHYV